jgi:hypothetical protein
MIEDIVAAHRIARERRLAGLPSWAYTIDIKEILGRDPNNESEAHAASVANEIAARLRTALPAAMLDWNSDNHDETIIEIVEGMEQLRADSYVDELDFSALKDLNNMLDLLYDWADMKRVWLG